MIISWNAHIGTRRHRSAGPVRAAPFALIPTGPSRSTAQAGCSRRHCEPPALLRHLHTRRMREKRVTKRGISFLPFDLVGGRAGISPRKGRSQTVADLPHPCRLSGHGDGGAKVDGHACGPHCCHVAGGGSGNREFFLSSSSLPAAAPESVPEKAGRRPARPLPLERHGDGGPKIAGHACGLHSYHEARGGSGNREFLFELFELASGCAGIDRLCGHGDG